MTIQLTLMPCLWLDDKAEEAATFYVSIFKNAKLGASSQTEINEMWNKLYVETGQAARAADL